MFYQVTWYIITWIEIKGRDRDMKVPNFLLFFIMPIFFLLTACQTEDIESEIYNHLEKTAEHEASLQTIREEMAQLESDEHHLYTRLIDESLDDRELIDSYVTEAKQLIDERLQLLEQEKEQMSLSKEEFLLVETLIDQIESEDVKQNAEEMYDIMIERYDIYDEW